MHPNAVGHVIAVAYTSLCEAVGELIGKPVEPLANHLIRATLEDGGLPEALAILESLALDYPGELEDAPLIAPSAGLLELAR
jgi:hypothetical protein